jgi:23S rRNA (guanosine2251-2'-O)-methyltransferase
VAITEAPFLSGYTRHKSTQNFIFLSSIVLQGNDCTYRQGVTCRGKSSKGTFNVTRKSGPRDPKTGFSPQKPAFSSRSNAKKAIQAGVKPTRERADTAFAPKSKDMVLIFGYHSVREALRSKRRKLIRLIATESSAERLAAEIAMSKVEVRIVTPEEILTRVPRDAVHQGMLLEARPLEDMDLSELSGKGIVLVLDQVTDPHNVGAILRTAAAFNVEAIVTTERHSPEMTGILAKSASGGLEHVAIASVVNLARALEELGDMGYQRVGLDSEGPNDLAETVLSSPVALVLGAEGKGLRRLSREKCDVLARLDMPGAIKSLNVSNACAVALSMVYQKLRL